MPEGRQPCQWWDVWRLQQACARDCSWTAAVHGHGPHLGRALPVHQGRGRGLLTGRGGVRPDGARRAAAAAHRRRARHAAPAAATLAVAARVRRRRGGRAVLPADVRRAADLQLADRLARGGGTAAGCLFGRLVGLADPMDARRLVGLLVGVVGVGVLVGLDLHAGSWVAVVAVLFAAAGYAIGPIVADQRLDGLPPLGISAVAMGVTAVAYLPFAFITGPRRPRRGAGRQLVGDRRARHRLQRAGVPRVLRPHRGGRADARHRHHLREPGGRADCSACWS